MQNLIKLIERILHQRLKLSLTINFDGQGGFKLKTELGDEATYKLLTEKRI